MTSFSNVNVNFGAQNQWGGHLAALGLEVPKRAGTPSTAPTTAAVSREISPRGVEHKLDLSQELKVHQNVRTHQFEHDTGAPEGFECFVGRMPITITEDMMHEMAKDFNPTECRILNKTDRAQHLCGFVVFDRLDMAQGFIAEFNGKTMVGGQYPLNVRFADGKNRKKIFIGGLAAGVREEDVRALTQAYGTILCIKMLNKNPKCPCGFVTFATGDQADACIRYLHDSPNADDTKNLVVKFAKTPEVDHSSKGYVRGGMKRGRDNYSSDYDHHKRGRKGKGKGRGHHDEYNNFMAPNAMGYTPESHYSSPATTPGFHSPQPVQYGQQQMQYAQPQTFLHIPDSMNSMPVSCVTSAACSPTANGAMAAQGFGMQPDVAQFLGQQQPQQITFMTDPNAGQMMQIQQQPMMMQHIVQQPMYAMQQQVCSAPASPSNNNNTNSFVSQWLDTYHH